MSRVCAPPFYNPVIWPKLSIIEVKRTNLSGKGNDAGVSAGVRERLLALSMKVHCSGSVSARPKVRHRGYMRSQLK
jgi:hypothetical protein